MRSGKGGTENYWSIPSPLNNVVFTGYKKSHEAFYMVWCFNEIWFIFPEASVKCMCSEWVWREYVDNDSNVLPVMLWLWPGRGSVLWSGPWLAAATSPGQWFRGGRKKSGSDDFKQLNRPGPGTCFRSSPPSPWRALGPSRYCGNFNSSNWFLTGCIITNKRRKSRVSSLPSVRFQSTVTN